MKIVAPVLKTEPCRMLFEIWLAVRGDCLLPRRADIDLVTLKPILPQILIIEDREPGIAQIRLAGTAYRDIYGFEPAGRNLIELTPAPFRRLRAYRCHMVPALPCAALAEVTITFSKRVSDLFELVALPLNADRTDGPRTAICAMASIHGQRWQNQDPTETAGPPAEIFHFIDIGAGMPPSTDPPDDFLRAGEAVNT